MRYFQRLKRASRGQGNHGHNGSGSEEITLFIFVLHSQSWGNLRRRSYMDTPMLTAGKMHSWPWSRPLFCIFPRKGEVGSKAGADEQRQPMCWPRRLWVGRASRGLTGCRSRRQRAGASCCSCDLGCYQRTGRRGHCGLGSVCDKWSNLSAPGVIPHLALPSLPPPPLHQVWTQAQVLLGFRPSGTSAGRIPQT